MTPRPPEARRLEERLAALTEIAASLTVDQPIEATLKALADSVVRTTGAVGCSVELIAPGTDELGIAGLHGLAAVPGAEAAAAWRGCAGVWTRDAIDARRPVLIRDARRRALGDPRCAPLHDLLRDAAWEAAISIPLVFRDRVMGALAGYYPAEAELADGEIAFLAAVADQAAVALENARLFAAARGKAVLEERQRLARELHDSVSQVLYGIGLAASAVRSWLDTDPRQAIEPADYVLSLVEAGLAEMRALLFELRPESLEREGLVGALGKQAAALRARHHLPVEAELGEEPEAALEAKEALYRVAQEALHNAVKHARATRVSLRLAVSGDELMLEVGDDGVGFDPTRPFPGHLGLRSMRERTERLGGRLEVESAPGRGTLVRARIPGPPTIGPPGGGGWARTERGRSSGERREGAGT